MYNLVTYNSFKHSVFIDYLVAIAYWYKVTNVYVK